jgi:hypothetical protein
MQMQEEDRICRIHAAGAAWIPSVLSASKLVMQ